MAIIKVEIRNCKDCPNFFESNGYSTDGFDFMVDWNCKLLNRKIQGAVEWHEEKEVPIPEDCPVLVEANIQTELEK